MAQSSLFVPSGVGVPSHKFSKDSVHLLVLRTFEEFFKNVANTTGLSLSRVKQACFKIPDEKVKDADKKVSSLVQEASEFIYGGETLAKLKEICKARGLKVSGTKPELMARIKDPNAAVKPPTKEKAPAKRKKKNNFKCNDVSKIIEKLQGKTSEMAIQKNSEGYYVCDGLVFNPSTKRVYAKWKDNRLFALIREDIDNCVRLGLLYDLPENLDHGSVKVTDKKVQEVLGEEDFKEAPEDAEDEYDGESSGDDMN